MVDWTRHWQQWGSKFESCTWKVCCLGLSVFLLKISGSLKALKLPPPIKTEIAK